MNKSYFLVWERRCPFGIDELTWYSLGHPQSDHNGALKGLLTRYKVGKVVESAKENDMYRYKGLYFDILQGGDSETKVLGKSSSEENEDAMVLSLKYLEFSALFYI